MIYSGSSYEFFELRIQPILQYPSIFGNYFKNLKFSQKEESTNYLQFSISYCSPAVHTPEFTGLKLEIKFYLSALLFFAGSLSGTIIPDKKKVPDPCGSG